MEKLNKICRAVMKLTENDFDEANKIVSEQKNYTHPLKNASQAKFRALGDHNQRVIVALKNLKSVIESGAQVNTRKINKS